MGRVMRITRHGLPKVAQWTEERAG